MCHNQDERAQLQATAKIWHSQIKNCIKNTVKTLENQNQKELVFAVQNMLDSNIHS